MERHAGTVRLSYCVRVRHVTLTVSCRTSAWTVVLLQPACRECAERPSRACGRSRAWVTLTDVTFVQRPFGPTLISRLRQLRSLLSWVILAAFMALGVSTSGHVHGLASDERAGHDAVALAASTQTEATWDEHDGAGAPNEDRGGQHQHDEHDCPICDAAIIASALALPTVAELPQAPAGSQRLEPLRHLEPVAQRFPASFDARGPPLSNFCNI